MVTGLLLVVAVLAFASLAYQQVPVSVPYTATEQFIRSQVATVPTLVESTSLTTATQIVGWDVQEGYNAGNGCGGFSCGGYYENDIPVFATEVMTSLFPLWSKATTSYSYTATSFVAASSTTIVPASVALGLTEVSFTALVLVVIGILALLTEWVMLKSRESTHKPKEAVLSQFVKAPIPPASNVVPNCLLLPTSAISVEQNKLDNYSGDIWKSETPIHKERKLGETSVAAKRK
jgi:hypothetical protein